MSLDLLLGVASTTKQFWFCVPVAFAVCLVNACTRFEDMSSIRHYLFRSLVYMFGFIAVMFVFLMWLTKGL
jgi:hypothetical protein